MLKSTFLKLKNTTFSTLLLVIKQSYCYNWLKVNSEKLMWDMILLISCILAMIVLVFEDTEFDMDPITSLVYELLSYLNIAINSIYSMLNKLDNLILNFITYTDWILEYILDENDPLLEQIRIVNYKLIEIIIYCSISNFYQISFLNYTIIITLQTVLETTLSDFSILLWALDPQGLVIYKFIWLNYQIILLLKFLINSIAGNLHLLNYTIILYTQQMYWYILNVLSISIVNIVLIIIFILIGGVIPLLERKYLSLIQRRIGPKFVGYNGRLQFIADAMKLLLKELIFLHNTNKNIMTILPIFVLGINIVLILNIVFLNSIQIIDNNYFVFTLILIELISVICLTYIGFLVKNKYTTIASVRLLNGIIVFEIFTTAVYIYYYLFYNKLGLQGVFNANTIVTKFLIFVLNLPIFINFVLILLKRVPYDIIEAETELIMGYSTEHSGFLSGALLLIEYLHIFMWSFFIIIFIF